MTPVTTDQAAPVVVGVDGSWKETGAVEWALEEALRTGAPLQVLHVAEKSRGEQPLAKLAEDAGMLVVGRNDGGSLARLLVGLTAENTIAAAKVPAVVVPDDWKPDEHRGGPVIVGIDADAFESNEDALTFAFESAAVRSVPVRIVYAWDLPHGYTGLGDGEVQRRERAKWEHFDNLVDRWRAKYPGVDVHVAMPRSDAVDALVGDAWASNAQLIVVGGRRLGRLAAFLLGSVTRGVLNHASCPVAVVHAPD